ncbi:MAG: alpha/beta hydrolase [Bacteroidota bacterium]|nr:alpha/beta hydrolase [Bacteroidota bacterium]MDP4214788.1 alpha/beta hydrolase [Bacteroidota bacterium]MDP4245502.1 alpha/beta hydrolase [Bacteroidota bacterium]MDP4252761.1 alpha/beta hydrolase [Bacteroidota bacterium]MDP4256833.1 alpha/beta hydrolase [Bacteroidota bacterium]
MDKTLNHGLSHLFYRVEGKATNEPPLLLIHGFAEDGRIWDGQVAALQDLCQVIIPDLPGSGRSSALRGETSMEEMAESIAALLDAEGIKQAVVVGHSMGGYISLAFAEKYPGRLSALGLFHSTAFADSEEKKALRRKSNEFIGKHGAAPFIQQSTPNLFAEDSREQHPEWVEKVISSYSAFNPHSLVYYYNAMIRRPDRTEILKQCKQPVLFIIGEKDNTIPLVSSLQQTHMAAISSIHILEKAGHMGMLEEAEHCRSILEEFMAFAIARASGISGSHPKKPHTNEHQP